MFRNTLRIHRVLDEMEKEIRKNPPEETPRAIKRMTSDWEDEEDLSEGRSIQNSMFFSLMCTKCYLKVNQNHLMCYPICRERRRSELLRVRHKRRRRSRNQSHQRRRKRKVFRQRKREAQRTNNSKKYKLLRIIIAQ